MIVALACMSPVRAQDAPECRNAGFETLDAATNFAEHWQIDIGGGADATVQLDLDVRHSGACAARISNRSALKAFVFASFCQADIAVAPSTTYAVTFWAKGRRARHCFLSVGFAQGGDRRLYLPAGDFDWRAFSCQFTTPDACATIALRFASDDVTEAFWVDDVSLERSAQQWSRLPEHREPRPFSGVFPRSRGPVARHLVVYDLTRESDDVRRLLLALQGLVNRETPRLYLINPTNPPHYDEVWLEYMREKGYTDDVERVATSADLLARFRDAFRGVIITDPDLPGSVSAACMIAGVERALPASPELAATLGLPTIMDLRGWWRRNVDAYRYVFDTYWDRMSHHVLAWTHPLSAHTAVRDYLTEFNVFCFWQSSYSDVLKGADPAAEEALINEVLSKTPANVPVMGWPGYGDMEGLTEYEGVRWLSEFGKFVPGTEFCSNLSVHTAIHPRDRVFRQRRRGERLRLEQDKVYVSVNILDSGDALWYWQLHQRKIWADPIRGTIPVGWCMNVTLYDMLPLVQQWYYEHATPNDEFFAGPSGLGYMNTQAYAQRFRAEDRERIWSEYVALTDRYCRKLDMRGVELYNGAWNEPTPPTPETFSRFTRGMKKLDYILADLGRHERIDAANANALVDNTAVFHTLTRFQVWSSSSEVLRDDMGNANAWLLNEITSHTPADRPGFMSAMAISWYYYPAWLRDLAAKLPPEYVVVTPHDMTALFKEARGKQPR